LQERIDLNYELIKNRSMSKWHQKKNF
jgi:hypothetical protein